MSSPVDEPAAKRSKLSNASADTGIVPVPTTSSVLTVLVDQSAPSQGTVQDQLAQLRAEMVTQAQLQEFVKVKDQEIVSLKATIKKQDVEIARLKATTRELMDDRGRKIIDLETTIEEMRDEALSQDARITTLTTLRITESAQADQVRQDREKKNANLEKQVAKLREKLAAVEKERDQAIKRASLAASRNAQPQTPGSHLRDMVNSINADPRQTMRKPNADSKKPHPEFKLVVLIYDDKTGDYGVEEARAFHRQAFPAGLSDIRKKALSMVPGAHRKSNLRLVLERPASASGKRFAFANDNSYAAWITEVRMELGRAAGGAGAVAESNLRCIRAYMWANSDGPRAESTFRAVAE